MITRTYTTKKECAHLFVNENFDNIDSTMVTDFPDWYETWSFRGTSYDDDFDPEDDGLGYVDPPMWNTWFEPADCYFAEKIEDMAKEVADLGFTLIYRDGDFWGLGIDGCGYSFYDAHWIPLYDLLGLTWHE